MDALRRQSDAHPFMAEDAQAELENWVGVKGDQELCGIWIARKNEFLGQWIKHGGFWPDPKLRLFRRGRGRFEDRAVHETVKVNGTTARLKHGAILHHCYPTLSDYIAAHEPLLFAGRRDGGRRGTHRVQRHQHRGAAAGDVLLQLFFSPGLS